MKITAGPEDRRLLHSAVAEETDHNLLRPGDLYDLFQGKRSGLYLAAVFICESRPSFPQGQGKYKDQCQEDLQNRDDPVSSGPSHPAGQSEVHDIRSGSGAKSPHTVEPAHMMAFVMKSHIVVQGGVNASRSQTIGNGPETEHPEGRADG